VKLKNYYEKTDDTRIYRAAVALHPGKRFTWFEQQWSKAPDGKAHARKAQLVVEQLWREHVNSLPSEAPTSSPTSTNLPTKPPSASDESSEDEDYTAAFGYYVPVTDNKQDNREKELHRFMKDKLDITNYEERPLAWWQERGEVLYPTLASLAFNLFATPGMSAECERAFSMAKKMVTDERYRLKADIIEADQCVKSWLQSGVVEGVVIYEILASIQPEDHQQHYPKVGDDDDEAAE
jgi:hypothetical protein